MTPDDIHFLFSRTNEYRSIRYDLENMLRVAAALGNPQEAFRSVLIAGTNGKGSVARFLSAMLPEAGLYTSPHLVRLHERIRIGPNLIPDEDLKAAFDRVRSVALATPDLLYAPTYFEFMTAIAFEYFKGRVAHAVVEVGLGGRLDATNIVQQDVSVITTIGLDHQEFLGNTVDAIAAEKAGIIKASEPVVTGPKLTSPVVRERAGHRLVSTAEVETGIRSLSRGLFEIDVATPVRSYNGLRPRLRGRHQIDNAVAAIRTAECLEAMGWPLSETKIRGGIESAEWPGRLQEVPGEPVFLLDGAHNIPAIQALAGFLAEFHPQGVWLIFGAMADKQWNAMLSIVRPHVRQCIFTQTRSARATRSEELQATWPGSLATGSVAAAIALARTTAPPDATVLVCGSLYVVGDAIQALGCIL